MCDSCRHDLEALTEDLHAALLEGDLSKAGALQLRIDQALDDANQCSR